MEGLGRRSGLSAASEGFVLPPRGGLCFPEHMAGDRGEALSFHVMGTTGHGEGTEQVAEARAQHGPPRPDVRGITGGSGRGRGDAGRVGGAYCPARPLRAERFILSESST